VRGGARRAGLPRLSPPGHQRPGPAGSAGTWTHGAPCR